MRGVFPCAGAVRRIRRTGGNARQRPDDRGRDGAELANARAKGKRLGRPVRDPGARARVVALKGEGLSLRQIAARECLSASGVRKMLMQAGVETAAPSSALASPQA